jgi:hypothetical protein
VKVTMGTEECSDGPRIPSNTLAALRGILISSLSRENVGDIDVESSLDRRRKVTFQESHKVHGEWYIICNILFPGHTMLILVPVASRTRSGTRSGTECALIVFDNRGINRIGGFSACVVVRVQILVRVSSWLKQLHFVRSHSH